MDTSSSIKLWHYPDFPADFNYAQLFYQNRFESITAGMPTLEQGAAGEIRVLHLHFDLLIMPKNLDQIASARQTMHFLEYVLRLRMAGWIVFLTFNSFEVQAMGPPDITLILRSKLIELCDKVVFHSESTLHLFSQAQPESQKKAILIQPEIFKVRDNLGNGSVEDLREFIIREYPRCSQGGARPVASSNFKTLVCILHYERNDLTLRLYNALMEGVDSSYDVLVIDNGSTSPISLPGIRLSKNLYFGGGLNAAFRLVQENERYDSLLFLNNDLIVNGRSFVKPLRELLRDNYKIISPSIIQPDSKQCFWPTMWNWGSATVRRVSWVDFMAPMFHRDFINEVKEYDSLLNYGWGNDIYSGIVCKERGWFIGVCDHICALHLSSQTIKSHGESTYKQIAERNMLQFFLKNSLFERFLEMRLDSLSTLSQSIGKRTNQLN